MRILTRTAAVRKGHADCVMRDANWRLRFPRSRRCSADRNGLAGSMRRSGVGAWRRPGGRPLGITTNGSRSPTALAAPPRLARAGRRRRSHKPLGGGPGRRKLRTTGWPFRCRAKRGPQQRPVGQHFMEPARDPARLHHGGRLRSLRAQQGPRARERLWRPALQPSGWKH